MEGHFTSRVTIFCSLNPWLIWGCVKWGLFEECHKNFKSYNIKIVLKTQCLGMWWNVSKSDLLKYYTGMCTKRNIPQDISWLAEWLLSSNEDICSMLGQSSSYIMSHVCVNIDWGWIGCRIYWTLTARCYNWHERFVDLHSQRFMSRTKFSQPALSSAALR
jgi:hypothetical protein